LPLPIIKRLGGVSKGVLISARLGASIISPTDGQVTHAGLFRSYGNLLTISAGDGYHVLIAGAGKLTAKKGQSIDAGAPVGSMRSEPLRDGSTNARAAVLYIELRKDGRAIDPSPWWATTDPSAKPSPSK